MGGGHLTRPDFGLPQADPAHPLTEFYLLAQSALDKAGTFALPALYAGLRAPARRIYADEARQYLRLAAEPIPGGAKLAEAHSLKVLYSTVCADSSGAPAALLLTEECTRATCVVRLLPPFLWDEPLPVLPDCTEAVSLQLTAADIEAIDASPAALGRRLVGSAGGKNWLRHPKAEAFLAQRVAMLQRLYR